MIRRKSPAQRKNDEQSRGKNQTKWGVRVKEQEKKEYLGRYKVLEQQIHRKMAELARWRSISKRVADYQEMCDGDKGSDRLRNAMEMIGGLQEEICKDIGGLIDLKREIGSCIDTVEDNTLRLLLQYRYIDGITFENIAEQMHYSWRWIIKLHGQALQVLEIDHGCSYPSVLH